MKYHTSFFRKLGKMSQNLSSAAVMIGALRANFAEDTRHEILVFAAFPSLYN